MTMPNRRRSSAITRRPLHNHLGRWLLPLPVNDHRPHLIRGSGLALMATVVFSLQAAAFAFQPAALRAVHTGSVLDYATDITPTDLFIQTNQQRTAAGLAPLHLSAKLNQSAGLKAQDMFAENYWAHVSPTGIQPWYWFAKAGYNYSYAGENLAKDFSTTSGVITGWMNSPGHRANILNSHYTDVGFAVENGTLVGGQTTLVVAHYGAPATATLAATNPNPPHSATPPATTPAKPATTPAPTPAPTPFITPTPAPSTAPTVLPATAAQITATTPPAKSYGLFAPLSLTRSLPATTLITLALLTLLLVVYALTHAVVWRKGLLRWRRLHYRLYAVLSLGVLAAAILGLATSGFGAVS